MDILFAVIMLAVNPLSWIAATAVAAALLSIGERSGLIRA